MNIIQKFLILLSKHERKNALLLLLLILVMAFLDMIGVASILPFMAVLTNPSIVETNVILNKMFQISKLFGVENNDQFLFALGVSVFILLIFSLAFKAFTTYVQLRFVNMREHSISKRFVESYLHQPYVWFLNKNSADLGKTILSEVSQIVAKGLKPLIEMIAKGMIALALIILLILTDPQLAFIIGFSLALAYVLIYLFSLKYLNKLGNQRLENNKLRFLRINEAFGAIKEIKISGLEEIYIKNYSKSSKTFARTQALAKIIAQMPRYALEGIAFGGIMLVILYLMSREGSFNNALPIISLYAFAGYRLLPALQQIYHSFTRISFMSPSLDELSNELKNLKFQKEKDNKDKFFPTKSIVLRNIYYSYPHSDRTALEDINIIIPAKTTVGIIGSTGSGKTTTIDIILGLLEAQKGTLEVDNTVISKQNFKSWQQSIGYVPQHIYLSDDTIAANIALGIEHKNIDQNLVEEVSKIANLHDFVKENLPQKYETIIGERGVRLSGGQRQRIGIARALYSNPQVIILDEATSALDNKTEELVMSAINSIGKDITIILIAHRLNTLRNCDTIFELEKGRVINKGNFNDLLLKKK
jgi:ABC-type multidrug transport system fused ATPase/permease subunit